MFPSEQRGGMTWQILRLSGYCVFFFFFFFFGLLQLLKRDLF